MPSKGRKTDRMTPGFTGPFKGEPQQGTLFDKRALDQLPGNADATRKRPGPRGYSPERLAEVRNAWETANVTGFHQVVDPETGKKHTEPKGFRPPTVEVSVDMNETGHQYGPARYDPHGNPEHAAGRARSRILDTLSRSTIPTGENDSPISGLSHIRVYSKPPHGHEGLTGFYQSHGTEGLIEPSLSPAWRGSQPPTKEATIGLTSHARDDYGRPMGTQAAIMGRDERAEQTLLHEIGHHDSYIEASDSSNYETPTQMAREEARADRFAVTHFRRDPRNKGSYDPRQNTYMGRGMHNMWAGAQGHYEHHLPADMHPVKNTRNMGPQFTQQAML